MSGRCRRWRYAGCSGAGEGKILREEGTAEAAAQAGAEEEKELGGGEGVYVLVHVRHSGDFRGHVRGDDLLIEADCLPLKR